MGAAFRSLAVVAALVLLASSGQSPAADAEAEFGTTAEATVGQNRVVLLSVTRTTEFVAGEGGKAPKAVTSVRVMYLMERTGDGKIGPIAAGAEVSAAGTTDKALRRLGTGGTGESHTNENFGGYAKRVAASGTEWKAAKLPAVKDADKAVVVGVTFHDVEVTAKTADIRVKVGTVKGEEDRVVFKNVPLE